MIEPWTKFRNLCQYYADCVKYSEKSQEYLSPDQLGETFILPRLPANWHLQEDEFEIDTSSDDEFVRSQLLKSSDESELFIGYPLNSFISPNGYECLCPLLMFPVTIAVRGIGYKTGLKMRIDRPGISVNQDWIEYHIPKDRQKAFQIACDQTEDESGCIDVAMVMNYLSAHFKSVNLDPNRMEFTVRNSQAKGNLLNTAVLFEGTKTKYTKTLISELHRISKEPDAVLDQTSLAYVFRDPCLPIPRIETAQKKIPVSFTKRELNAGQFAAIETSLNTPAVKVMGPPGTGKSFMAVNLIANEVLNGGSVLFTSKNHKAIHAIYDKAPDAIANKDFPLVSFCTTPDNPTNADWQKTQKDVDSHHDKVESLLRNAFKVADIETKGTLQSPARSALDVALSAYKDAEGHIARYSELRETMARYERVMLSLEEYIGSAMTMDCDSPERIALLEECRRLLEMQPKDGLWARIMSWLRGEDKKARQAIDRMLKDIAPTLANTIISKETKLKNVQRLLDAVKYRVLVKAWGKTTIETIRREESQCNDEALKEVVKNSLAEARQNVQTAYLEGIANGCRGVENHETLLATCQSASEQVLKTANLEFLSGIDDEAKYDAALAQFKKYHAFFPAWAATMLSLRRASPCLPGVFSLAIIDEASQCEIPPMIPVLFRSKRVAVVGDPNQFPPVITLTEAKDKRLRRKYRFDAPEYRKFDFRGNNVFSVVPGKPLLLNEHFRCADDIAEYFNDEFYDGRLSLCCDFGRDGASAVGGCKPGMAWIDAPGGDESEMEAALEYLKGLHRQNFKGTIGVISPLRDLANNFKTLVAQNKTSAPKQLDIQTQIDTANGFQGGECDVILFLLGLNGDRTRGQDWYITAAENKYIYNVSVSRAKHLFVAFGDRKQVALCGLSYIQKLIPETRPPRKVSEGPGERKLKAELLRAGIETVPQFPVLNRYLDLAIPSLKIDIEVDGQAWHLDCHGCRKADDTHRDIQLEAAGWHTIRCWHHDVENDPAKCVARIKAFMARYAPTC